MHPCRSSCVIVMDVIVLVPPPSLSLYTGEIMTNFLDKIMTNFFVSIDTVI